MADIPRLYNPDGADNAADPRQTLESKGVLRVLAYAGDDFTMEELQVAARVVSGPLALLKFEKLNSLFGETITELQRRM